MGFRVTRTFAHLDCETILAQSANEADRLAWWKKKVHWLKNPTIDAQSLHITSASVFDENGVDITATALAQFPNELKHGQIADWMGKATKVIELKALATFNNYRDGNHVVETRCPVDMPIHVKIHATDAATGDYSAIKSYEEGEPEPLNLARDIYDAHAALQWDATLDWEDSEVPAGVVMGKRATVICGTKIWLNLLIQQTTERPHSGQMTVKLGPASQLGITDLIELLRVNRYRLIYNAPSSRSTGQAGGGNEVELGKDLPKENSTEDASPASKSAVSADAGGGNTTVVLKDAVAQKLVLDVRNATGSRNTNFASVEAALADLGGRQAKFRWIYFKDAKNNCAAMKMLVLGTAPEADS